LKTAPPREFASPIVTGFVDLSYSANASAHETPVVLDAHSAARKKIRDGCDRLLGTLGAGTDCQDEITQRKPRTRLQYLLILLHSVPVLATSNSDAISRCEYLVHANRAVIHFLCTLELTAEQHFCSIFEHKKLIRAKLKPRRLLKSLRQSGKH